MPRAESALHTATKNESDRSSRTVTYFWSHNIWHTYDRVWLQQAVTFVARGSVTGSGDAQNVSSGVVRSMEVNKSQSDEIRGE